MVLVTGNHSHWICEWEWFDIFPSNCIYCLWRSSFRIYDMWIFRFTVEYHGTILWASG